VKTKIIYVLFLIAFCGCNIFKPVEEQKVNEILNKVEVLTETGKFNDAYKEILNLKRINKSPEFLFYKGFLIHKIEKNPSKAIRFLKKAESLLQNKKSSTQDPLLAIKIEFYLSYAYRELKKEEDAEKFLNSAFSRLEKNFSLNRFVNGEAMYMLAYIYSLKNKKEESLLFYNKAILWFKDNNPLHFYYPASFFNIGLQYYNEKNYSEAVKFWQKAFELEPSDGWYKDYYKKWLNVAMQAYQAGF